MQRRIRRGFFAAFSNRELYRVPDRGPSRGRAPDAGPRSNRFFECGPPGGSPTATRVDVFRVAGPRARGCTLCRNSPAAHWRLGLRGNRSLEGSRASARQRSRSCSTWLRLGPRHHDFVGEYVLLRERDHFRLRRNWTVIDDGPHGSRRGACRSLAVRLQQAPAENGRGSARRTIIRERIELELLEDVSDPLQHG